MNYFFVQLYKKKRVNLILDLPVFSYNFLREFLNYFGLIFLIQITLKLIYLSFFRIYLFKNTEPACGTFVPLLKFNM